MSRPLYRMLNNLLDSFDPEDAAKNSFENYHAVGLTYLNLLRTPRLTAKLYISEPGTKHNNQGYLVCPHAHRYNFETLILSGSVGHFYFSENEAGTDWNRFKFRSIVNGGKGFELDRVVRLTQGRETLRRGDSYYMTTDQIHTINVDDEWPTVQFQIQYHDVPEPSTYFYSRETAPPSVEGLYTKITPERASQLLKRVEKILNYD